MRYVVVKFGKTWFVHDTATKVYIRAKDKALAYRCAAEWNLE